MRTNLFVLFFCLLGGMADAQHPKEKLSALFSELSGRDMINGNVLAAEKGKVLYQQSFGLRDIASTARNDSGTSFELASLSKVFTAVAVMQLVERRSIALDATVQKYLPEFPYAGITIRQLLSHTSGLPDFELFDQALDAAPGRIMTNADIIPALKKWGPLKLSPGRQWHYSSPGMGLLALVVEKVTELKFREYLDRNIFKQAGMTATYSALDPGRQKSPRKAVPYALPYYFSSDFVLADTMARNIRFLHASGGVEGPGLLVSNTGDLFRFDEALFHGRLLKLASLKTMFTPQDLADGTPAEAPHFPGKALFGLGWFILKDDSAGRIVFHSGYKPGTASIFLHNIDRQQCVIVLDNGSSPGVPAAAMSALRLLNRQEPYITKTGLTFPFAKTLLKDGTDAALLRMQVLATDTAHYAMAARDWIAMGYEFFRTGHQEEALSTFRTGFTLYPGNDFLCMLYADTLLRSNKKAEARTLYERAQKLNPKNPEVASRLEKLAAMR